MFKYNFIIDEIKQLLKTDNTLVFTEKSVCDRFKVSRITARRALSELSNLNVIIRKQRVGSMHLDRFLKKKIAVILAQEQTNNYKILDAIIKESEKCSYTIEPFFTMMSKKNERIALQKIVAGGFDGLIFFPSTPFHHADLISKIIINKTPICAIDTAPEGFEIPLVTSDNYWGSKAIVLHLISKGHKRIGYMFQAKHNRTQSEERRFAGYCSALIESGISVDEELLFSDNGKFSEMIDLDIHKWPLLFSKVINQAFEHIKGMDKKPTALFVLNDITAEYVFHAMHEHNVSLNMEIAGFDNLESSKKLGFSTVEQNFYALGKKAFEVVYKTINGEQTKGKEYKIKTSLIIR